MWLIVAVLLSTLIVLVARGLQDQARVVKDWQLVLKPWGAEVYDQLEKRLAGESQLADFAYGRAFKARAAGSREEAVRMLEVGLRLVERTSPDMIALLQGMAAMSRMEDAVAPTPPLRHEVFRLRALSGLALFGGFLHRFLVSTAERFRLRAYVLGRGFGLLTRFIFASTQRIRSKKENLDPEWDRIASARQDLKTLSSESLRTFHTLVVSLAARQR